MKIERFFFSSRCCLLRFYIGTICSLPRVVKEIAGTFQGEKLEREREKGGGEGRRRRREGKKKGKGEAEACCLRSEKLVTR